MLRTPKETIVTLAKEAGLVYNTECIPGGLHKFHRKALYDFTELLEKLIMTNYNQTTDKDIV